jgi:16S rRNA (uracil1498-N3)-methyltransferase
VRDTIKGVIRRVHVDVLRTGEVELSDTDARHVRNVLRLTTGTPLELFDDVGGVATGQIVALDPRVVVRVNEVRSVSRSTPRITIASAIPKGERADWMIEKLSELGCDRFLPLAASRSVVLPEGKNKRERWIRIATESAKQSRRRGVMSIDALTSVGQALTTITGPAVFLSTEASAPQLIATAFGDATDSISLFIGPEGGWTDDEIALFERHHVRPLKLTNTVLRVETAAIAAMAVVACSLTSNPRPPR